MLWQSQSRGRSEAGEDHVGQGHGSSSWPQSIAIVLPPLYPTAGQSDAVHLQKNVRKEIVSLSLRFRCRRLLKSHLKENRGQLKRSLSKTPSFICVRCCAKSKCTRIFDGLSKTKNRFHGRRTKLLQSKFVCPRLFVQVIKISFGLASRNKCH